ncbi:sugar ABC transporter substrate-binding protein [Saccharothrix sp. Mg75]|uniref:sugar ABC transporter substrate-binding protein n=1 Tax=Saccharothrix sp. Mg75 TaxID=3445357 RepID=UPI003EEEFE9F
MSRSPFAAGVLALTVVASVTACSSPDASTPGASAPFTLWDPYPQQGPDSAWAKAVASCGAASGVTIERTGHDTTDLTTKVLLAAQQDVPPTVLVVDNPVVSTLAEGGVLRTAEELGADISGVEPNLVAAGQLNGRTYGVPIGANTLALYYNEAVLAGAGVDVASIRDWASLTAALDEVVRSGKKGITFSAVGTEEGTFQFLPWFWGAGAELTDLSSADAAAALDLWKGWLDKGYAPTTVVGNTQTASWQEFETGEYAFAENGTWQLSGVAGSGLDIGVLPIPGRTGGTAPAPTGGEFVTVPVQADSSRDATARTVVDCLTSGENALAVDTALSYVSARPDVQAEQVAAEPGFSSWVRAVKAARGRTADGLGTKYPRISEPLWNAVQAGLTGSLPVRDALSRAQSAVG